MDRIDTLVGLFGVGKKPTGNKDPFPLRRQALAIVRILIENQWSFDLIVFIQAALAGYELQNTSLVHAATVIPELLHFCTERLKAWYLEQGITPHLIESVFSKQLSDPYDIHCRLLAIQTFQTLPIVHALAQANKRVHKLLVKYTDPILPLDHNILSLPAEQRLLTQLAHCRTQLAILIPNKQYVDALNVLATLQGPIDQFFTEVLIMDDNVQLRQQRFSLLHALRQLFLEVADISLL
jgi:glycyl-tRNA synthetase beta chain